MIIVDFIERILVMLDFLMLVHLEGTNVSRGGRGWE